MTNSKENLISGVKLPKKYEKTVTKTGFYQIDNQTVFYDKNRNRYYYPGSGVLGYTATGALRIWKGSVVDMPLKGAENIYEIGKFFVKGLTDKDNWKYVLEKLGDQGVERAERLERVGGVVVDGISNQSSRFITNAETGLTIYEENKPPASAEIDVTPKETNKEIDTSELYKQILELADPLPPEGSFNMDEWKEENQGSQEVNTVNELEKARKDEGLNNKVDIGGYWTP